MATQPHDIVFRLMNTIQSIPNFGHSVIYGNPAIYTQDELDVIGWQSETEMDGGQARFGYWKIYWTGCVPTRGPTRDGSVPQNKILYSYAFVCEGVFGINED